MEKIFVIISSMIAMVAAQFKNKDSVESVKETKEALIGINEVAVKLASKFKDGVQFTDFTEFYADLQNDQEFKDKVQAAYDGHKKIPAEVKDIDVGEGLELAGVQLDYTPKIIAAFAK